jgi:hypothetical protein
LAASQPAEHITACWLAITLKGGTVSIQFASLALSGTHKTAQADKTELAEPRKHYNKIIPTLHQPTVVVAKKAAECLLPGKLSKWQAD